ncbi:hypothetical protein MUA52_00415 [Staphylococcus agnetis]|uniref:hypothetical protein n=1 Tax=Staphylococcus agnetis TaxID=985762 RepID=UPI0021CFF90A|nr:hypothetical protein [Staphylococcus agnetis]UXU66636.1 hypothetical protein MUA52_00415 [Staphylococcus agnetis]
MTYFIDTSGINMKADDTSIISSISYEVENANYNNLSNLKIREQFISLSEIEMFPKHLKYVSSHTDPVSGTTVCSFENTNTGKVIIGMTGTNLQKEAFKSEGSYLIQDFNDLMVPGVELKIDPLINAKRESNYKKINYTLQDVVADANIAIQIVTDEDRHFKSTQNYIKDLKKEHDIDTITGHSLGGRDAMIMGMSNDIKKIVTYNTAPLYLKNISEFLNTNEASKSDRIDYLTKNYNGKITHFISDNDELDWWVKQNDYVLPGEEVLISNGENHFMSGFFGKYEQSIITNKLKKPNKFESAMKKSFKKNINYTKNKLNEINDIKSVMIMQNGGGALSSSQQKLLEYVTALAIVKGLSQQLTDDINELNKLYDEMKEIFKKNWDDALESGHIIGKNLSSQEVLSALKEGDAYEDKMVTTPIDKINEKIKKLNATAAQYSDFITKVEDGINQIINKDQILANQIGGLL